MAINRVVRAALKALSYPDIDLKKNYRIKRKLQEAISYPVRKLRYEAWDYEVLSGDHRVPVRIFHPAEGTPLGPLLLFFHGGGWVSGTIDSYNDVCASMALLTGRRVVSVDYSLAPEHPFPAGLLDCYAVAKTLFLHPGLLGAEPEDICLIGDSAGGNLAAAVSLMARDLGEFLPSKQILLYPATHFDHSESSPFASVRENGTDYLLTSKSICDYMDLYLFREEDRRNPYVAPLLSEDLSRQPDTLLITAQYDPLRDEGEAYGKALAAAGNRCKVLRFDDALHGFFSLPPSFALVKEAYRAINAFLEEEVAHAPTAE